MKPKIVVYAICKNEEKHVNRWYESVKEADEIYVLDTGSTDNTVDLLKEKGINVSIKRYDNFRFDVARNDSLKLVPDDVDICVCCDLDEVFQVGWRNLLESSINKDITRVSYTYNWLLENNVPKVTFLLDKIHTKKDYIWVNPVHEILKNINGNEKYVINELITLNHYPDQNKSRSSYLSLLELSVKENPLDDRSLHYLGREYMYYQKWNQAIDTLIKHLNLKSATWKDERCASMRFISRCYKNLDRYYESRMWLEMAIKEAPHLREPYIDYAMLEYQYNNWSKVILLCNEALKIKIHPKTYINEIYCYDETPYDLLSIAYYNIGNYKESLINSNIALQYNPDSKRLIDNNTIIKNKKQVY